MASEIYLLNVRGNRRGILSGISEGHGGFSEAVPQFSVARGRRIIVLVSFEDKLITHIAYGIKGNPVVTRSYSLKLSGVQRLENPVNFGEIVSMVGSSWQSRVMKVLERGGLLPTRTRDYTLNAVIVVNPSAAKFLNTDSEKRKIFFKNLKSTARENFSFQRDCIHMALEFAEMQRDLLQWDIPDDKEDDVRSIAELIPAGEVRAGEDIKISTDWGRIPGFEESYADQYHLAARTFYSKKKPRQKLTVIMANKETLEKQTGADLIYCNDTHKNFIMVQYKNMNDQYENQEIFRWSNGDKFIDQVNRMDNVLQYLNNIPIASDSRNYRFTTDPFFLKICKQSEVKVDDIGMVKGMYIPLEYWKRRYREGRFNGPNGGHFISYGNVGRYISNSDFIRYMVGGWIGTSVDHFDILAPIVEYLLNAKRTVAIAFVDKKEDTGIP